MAILKVTRLPANKDEQVRITILEMIRLVRASWWAEPVRRCADTAAVEGFSPEEKLEAMSRFVRRKMLFLLDPKEVELIRLPVAIAREILYAGRSWGDCDDFSLILAAMTTSHGYQTGFVTISTSPHNREFRHVFVCVALDDGKILFLDPSVSRPYETGHLRIKTWWIPGMLPPRI